LPPQTTNLLLAAGDAALTSSPAAVPALPPLAAVAALHRDTAASLGVDAATVADVEALLGELTQLLVGVSIVQELTPRARDSLVSFGERLSTRLFAAHLRAEGVPARAVDAFAAGLTTTDDFGAADVDYGASLPALKRALGGGGGTGEAGQAGAAAAPPSPPPVAVVTGFLGRGARTGAITTLGRGGSDLTATLVGAALGVAEVTVWKDVDGVLTGDPRIAPAAAPVPALTYDEATELAFFGAAVLHPLAMQPALGGNGGAAFDDRSLGVRVRNSYNRRAPGTLITATRDMAASPLVTSVVLKDGVTMIDAVSVRAPGQVGFLASLFDVFRECGVSVDVVATSEVSVSLTLDPARVWSRDLVDSELDALLVALARVSKATATRGVACVSLVCDVARSAAILERAFRALGAAAVPVLMMSQGASKTNISLVVGAGRGEDAVRVLHKEFFE
jgi:aspartate kinase